MAAKADSVSDKARATQERLLDAGVELFALHGYDGASTRMIETAAGVKRNLISYHFDSKEEFLSLIHI